MSTLIILSKVTEPNVGVDLKIIVSALVGVTAAFLYSTISEWVRNSLKRKKEVTLILAELDAIYKHILSNLNIIESIDLKMGVPHRMHFEKMKIHQNSILFSSETFRMMSSKHGMLIYRLKLILRNIDIEAQAIVDYIDGKDYDVETMNQYLDYFKRRLEKRLKNNLHRIKNSLTKHKTGFESISPPSSKATIIYKPAVENVRNHDVSVVQRLLKLLFN
jgi:hypothetical protein